SNDEVSCTVGRDGNGTDGGNVFLGETFAVARLRVKIYERLSRGPEEGRLGKIGLYNGCLAPPRGDCRQDFWRIRLRTMSNVKFMIGLLAWAAVAVLGFWSLALYETRPGCAADPPPDWPDRSRLRCDPDRPTLLMFLHPHCPCSRASLEELTVLLA